MSLPIELRLSSKFVGNLSKSFKKIIPASKGFNLRVHETDFMFHLIHVARAFEFCLSEFFITLFLLFPGGELFIVSLNSSWQSKDFIRY